MINRILIVNDSALERQFIINALKDTYLIDEAGSGKEAFKILDTNEFDIIILDNIMENETGYDIARKLRQDPKYDDVDLLLMSANNNAVDKMAAYESGFSGYILKNQHVLSYIKKFERKQAEIKIKVLVVDDSRIVRSMISNAFKKEGFSVKTAESGQQAIEKLKTFTPDFITMDVEMKGLNGFQVSKIIRTIPRVENVPIVIISGTDSVESELKGIESGVADYFIKPFPPMQLAEYIRNVTHNLNNPGDKRVLLIGTSFPEHYVIQYSLNKEGIKTITAPKGEDIPGILGAQDIGLIIVDFDEGDKVPDFEYLRQLKIDISNANKTTPVLVLTTGKNKLAALEAYKVGADDYLSAPFCVQELMLRVNSLINPDESEDDEIVIEL